MRVLLLGKDRESGEFRAKLLRAAGHQVEFPRSRSEAKRVIETGNFEVTVICYSLSDKTTRELAELVRQRCPPCAIITISQAGLYDRKVEHDVGVPEGDHKKLLETIAEVANKRRIPPERIEPRRQQQA